MGLSERTRFGFPDYGCDVATEGYRDQDKFGTLLKLHGSLNWLHCPSCQRLDVGISDSGRRMAKQLEMLYKEEIDSNMNLEARYSCHGSECRDCGTYVRPVMITPTHLKDYRNPHISQVWYQADRALRRADHAVIVGYSLPEDDVDVIYLLKRGLSHLSADRITVVEYDPDRRRPAREHPVGQRYRTLFGDDIDWHPEGFEDFLA
jgi:NAD-dependent SIR2 family protein deacetylase